MNNSLLKKSITAAAALVVISSGAAPRFEASAPIVPKALTNRSLVQNLTSNNASSEKKIPAKAEELVEVLIDEDFSLWTEGTQEDPIYLGDIEGFLMGELNYDINPDRMQNGKTWGGYATCTAGEMCGLTYPGVGGMIQTSQGDFSGDLHITAKVKMMDGQSSPQGMLIGAICTNWYEPQPVPGNSSPYYMLYVPNDGEWHEVDWTYTNTYGGDDCFIQFNTYSQILLDDLKITTTFTSLANPQPLPATNFTLDGFTANWAPVSKATDYLLTCWRDVPTSDELGKMVCDFDQINNTDGIINMEDPNFPEGWEFYFNGATPRLLTPADGLDTYAFCFDTDGQSITSPSTGSPIIGVSMNLRVIGEEDEYGFYPGNLTFAGWDGFNWVALGSLYFDADFYGEYLYFDEVNYILEEYGKKFYKIKFAIQYMSEGYAIALDDIDITTLPPTERDYVLTEFPVEGTSYVLTDLDPESDYTYEVSARNTELGIDSGTPDACTYAFGLPPVTPLPATDADSTGAYTANWEAAPKAQEYVVNNFLVFTAQENIEDYVILEEYFEKVNFGFTVEDPYAFNNFEFANLDELCDNPGWIGYLCGIAEFAIGGVGMPAYGYGGELQSPWLSVGNNGGKYTVVVSACGQPGDYLCVVNSKNEGYKIELTADYEEYTLEFEGGTEFEFLGFYTQNCGNFFINYVQVTQNLKKGDRVLSQRDEYRTSDTSYRITDLEMPGEEYSYAYTVTGLHIGYFDIAASDLSEVVYVDFKSTDIETAELSYTVMAKAGKGEIIVSAPEDINVSIIAANGMKMAAFAGSKTVNVPAGMYIVKAADKTFKLIVK